MEVNKTSSSHSLIQLLVLDPPIHIKCKLCFSFEFFLEEWISKLPETVESVKREGGRVGERDRGGERMCVRDCVCMCECECVFV